MNSERAREIAERDQLWASLRALRAEIDRLASGNLDGSPPEQQLVMLLARIVAAKRSYTFT